MMKAHGGDCSRERDHEEPSEEYLGDGPIEVEPAPNHEHGELLRMIIAEGAQATLETFFEAKDPNIDPALKLKLVGLASSIGDNVRKAIATHASHFRGEG